MTTIDEIFKKNETETLDLPKQINKKFLDDLYASGDKAMFNRGIHLKVYGDRENSFFNTEKIKMVKAIPYDLIRIVRYWDLAASEKPARSKQVSWTVGAKLGLGKDMGWYLLDIVRIRKNPRNVELKVQTTADLDGPKIHIWIEQEPGATGVSAILRYKRDILSGYVCHPHKPSGSKVIRAEPVSSQVDAGNFHILQGRWNNDFIEELEDYPEGTLDQVDAISGAMFVITHHYLKSKRRVIVHD